MSVTRQTVEKIISESPVFVFSKTYCPYCTKVKTLFAGLGVNFGIMELDKRDDGDSIQSILREITGASSVPRVFIGGQSVGGCDDTHSEHRSGKLKQRLASVGINIA